MAQFKYKEMLQQNKHGNFDIDRAPGEQAPDGGIYRCMNCGREIGIAKGSLLPAQTHHVHKLGPPTIRWRLVICPDNQV